MMSLPEILTIVAGLILGYWIVSKFINRKPKLKQEKLYIVSCLDVTSLHMSSPCFSRHY